jgi:hypothetical protein
MLQEKGTAFHPGELRPAPHDRLAFLGDLEGPSAEQGVERAWSP